MLLINKKWDSCISEHLSGYASIFFQIPCDHCNLTIMIILFPYQPEDSPCNFFCLFLGIASRKKTDFLLGFPEDFFPVTEDILFQKLQRRCMGKSGSHARCNFYGFFYLSGKFCQIADHLVTHIKKLMRFSSRKYIFPYIHGNCHCHFPAHSQKLLNDFVLYRSKTGISVQQHFAAFQLL